MAPQIGVSELVAGIRAGDRTALSRAITLIESRRSDHQELAQELIAELLPATGGARRIGLTGVPGAGKSTLLEALGVALVEQGHRVAALSIDPSSTRTGGSILGDKTRMPKLSLLDGAYIRPSPAAGMLGGVAKRTREALLLCEAAGFDVVVVESVGVGQSEADLAELTDHLCLLLVPGAGDELQGIKRGIVELADLVVVNKADGERISSARRSAGDYRRALRLLPPSTPGWKTPVLTVSALEGIGIAELWESIGEHRALMEQTGALQERRSGQQQRWLAALVEEAVLDGFHGRPGVREAFTRARAAVADQELTVPQAAEQVLRAATAQSE